LLNLQRFRIERHFLQYIFSPNFLNRRVHFVNAQVEFAIIILVIKSALFKLFSKSILTQGVKKGQRPLFSLPESISKLRQKSPLKIHG
jgi:hypothetical protein